MGTMGLALGPCSLPGQVTIITIITSTVTIITIITSTVTIIAIITSTAISVSFFLSHYYSYQCDFQGPLFTVAADAMELGLGVHGEAGVASMPLSNARYFLNCSSIALS